MSLAVKHTGLPSHIILIIGSLPPALAAFSLAAQSQGSPPRQCSHHLLVLRQALDR